MKMEVMIFVIGGSYLLSVLLNKIAKKKGWKNKVTAYLDQKPAMRNLPMVIGVVGVILLMLLPNLGFKLFAIIPIQVIVITIAVFLFELFREE